MARTFGYGGIANTNGARDFAGKEASLSEPRGPQPARVLGYGGIANTLGARDFSGKTEAEVPEVIGDAFQGFINANIGRLMR